MVSRVSGYCDKQPVEVTKSYNFNFHCNLGVEALARGCPKLRSFMSSGCTQVDDDAVLALAEHCPLLEVVNLFGCNVSGR